MSLTFTCGGNNQYSLIAKCFIYTRTGTRLFKLNTCFIVTVYSRVNYLNGNKLGFKVNSPKFERHMCQLIHNPVFSERIINILSV